MKTLLLIATIALVVAIAVEAVRTEPKQRICGCKPIDAPVCATNRKVYRNICEMGCDATHVGPKLKVLEKGSNCPVCGCGPDEPVCGANSVTYASSCDLGCDLVYPDNYILHKGPCEPKRS